jgi:hypothetical protein
LLLLHLPSPQLSPQEMELARSYRRSIIRESSELEVQSSKFKVGSSEVKGSRKDAKGRRR